MTRREFEDGLPHSMLEGGDSLEVLQESYGRFAINVLMDVKRVDIDAPDDILTVGDNWLQLVEMIDVSERMLQLLSDPAFKDNWQIGDMLTPASANMWPIENRGSGDNIQRQMMSLQEGIKAGVLKDRIMKKLAVLDLTTVDPLLQEQDLSQRTDTPWGINGMLAETDTLIYHITSGFYKYSVQNVKGRPDDNRSAARYTQGEMKWD